MVQGATPGSKAGRPRISALIREIPAPTSPGAARRGHEKAPGGCAAGAMIIIHFVGFILCNPTSQAASLGARCSWAPACAGVTPKTLPPPEPLSHHGSTPLTPGLPPIPPHRPPPPQIVA